MMWEPVADRSDGWGREALPGQVFTQWDGGLTIWDNGKTLWDFQEAGEEWSEFEWPPG